ncbi:MAG: hypothetical protein RIR22_1671, partial [Planctomycetota bacterium]
EWQSKQFSTMIFMATLSEDCAETIIEVDNNIIRVLRYDGCFNIF